MNIITLNLEDLNAILKWYNLAFSTEKNPSNFEEIPDEKTLIKIKALFLTKEEDEGFSKRLREFKF